MLNLYLNSMFVLDGSLAEIEGVQVRREIAATKDIQKAYSIIVAGHWLINLFPDPDPRVNTYGRTNEPTQEI